MPVPNKRQKTSHSTIQSESPTQRDDVLQAPIGQSQAEIVSNAVSGQSTQQSDQSALRSQQQSNMRDLDREEVTVSARNGLTEIHKPHLLWEVRSICLINSLLVMMIPCQTTVDHYFCSHMCSR